MTGVPCGLKQRRERSEPTRASALGSFPTSGVMYDHFQHFQQAIAERLLLTPIDYMDSGICDINDFWAPSACEKRKIMSVSSYFRRLAGIARDPLVFDPFEDPSVHPVLSPAFSAAFSRDLLPNIPRKLTFVT